MSQLDSWLKVWDCKLKQVNFIKKWTLDTNKNQNGVKSASELPENGTILKIVEETDFGPLSLENGGEKVIHFNENAEVVSNGSHSDDSDSGEEDATSL